MSFALCKEGGVSRMLVRDRRRSLNIKVHPRLLSKEEDNDFNLHRSLVTSIKLYETISVDTIP